MRRIRDGGILLARLRPGHDGVDIAATKATPIHAAASGVVLRAVRNAFLTDGTPYSSDVDGHPCVPAFVAAMAAAARARITSTGSVSAVDPRA